jgi:hypothetical protein
MEAMVLAIQIFGLIVLGGLLFAFLWQNAPFRSADVVRTHGSVISHSSTRDRVGDTFLKPKVRFTDAAGQVREIDDWVSFSTPRSAVGARVEVEYLATDSAQARVRHPYILASFYLVISGAIALIVWSMAVEFP